MHYGKKKTKKQMKAMIFKTVMVGPLNKIEDRVDKLTEELWKKIIWRERFLVFGIFLGFCVYLVLR